MNHALRTTGHRSWRGLLSLTLLGSLAAAARSDIVNGDFEGADLAPWTLENGGIIDTGGGTGHVAQLDKSGVLSQLNWRCGDQSNADMVCVITFDCLFTNAQSSSLAVRFSNGGLDFDTLTPTTIKANDNGWHSYKVTSKECTIKQVQFKADVGFPNSVRIDNVSSMCVPVPEPGTMAALGLGFLGLLKPRKKA
ncbi:PEP-CTERM sorting domain-containing protein [bacterium]|nr:MAG: PEP-CTERM sorting domain-containing protein [bacterium]